MAAELKVKSGGSWRTITDPEVKYSGAWRAIKTIEVKIAGVWQQVFSVLVVSAAANGAVNVRAGATCYAGVSFNLDGNEKEYLETGSQTAAGVWLDSGSSSDVWVERIVTSGSWNSIDPGAGRHQLSINRNFQIVQPIVGTVSVTGYFKFWDAASGGNLLQQTGSATYSAQRT